MVISFSMVSESKFRFKVLRILELWRPTKKGEQCSAMLNTWAQLAVGRRLQWTDVALSSSMGFLFPSGGDCTDLVTGALGWAKNDGCVCRLDGRVFHRGGLKKSCNQPPTALILWYCVSLFIYEWVNQSRFSIHHQATGQDTKRTDHTRVTSTSSFLHSFLYI